MAVSLWNPLVLAVLQHENNSSLYNQHSGKAFPHSYSKELYAKIYNLKDSEHKT